MPKFRITAPDGKTYDVTAPEGASQDEVLAYVQSQHGVAQEQPQPANISADSEKPPISNAMLPAYSANKAIVGLGDAVLNAPTNLYNLGKAAVGTAATAAGHPEYAPDISPNPDFVSSLANRAGIDVGDKNLTQGQRLADSALQGATSAMVSPATGLRNAAGNVALGAISGGAGGATYEATGSPTASLLASILAPAIAHRIASPQPNLNSVREQTINDSRDAGYVLPPSEMSPGGLTGAILRMAEGFGGKAAMGQSASIRNQANTNRLIREDLGIPGHGQISEQDIAAAQAPHFENYARAGNLSPNAAQALQGWRQANNDARDYQAFYRRSGDPAAQRSAETARNDADQWMQIIQQEAHAAGHPQLAQDLADSRISLARIGTIDRALNDATGDVSAPALAAALRRGVPLTGNAETAANFAQGFDRFAQTPKTTSMPGVSNLQALLAIGLGAGVSPVAAAVPYAMPLARGALLSRPVQWAASPGNSAPKQALIDAADRAVPLRDATPQAAIAPNIARMIEALKKKEDNK